MSRIGKKIIAIPDKTEVTNSGGVITVKGPLGTMSRDFTGEIAINISEKEVTLRPIRESLENSALWGTYSSHVSNMIAGVNKAFEKKLIVEGIGFKAEVKGDVLQLNLGFSHMIKVNIPKDLKVTSEKNIITVSGVNKETVGQFTAQVRALKKPEPYKGKGIRYIDEVIRRKQGKKTT